MVRERPLTLNLLSLRWSVIDNGVDPEWSVTYLLISDITKPCLISFSYSFESEIDKINLRIPERTTVEESIVKDE